MDHIYNILPQRQQRRITRVLIDRSHDLLLHCDLRKRNSLINIYIYMHSGCCMYIYRSLSRIRVALFVCIYIIRCYLSVS